MADLLPPAEYEILESAATGHEKCGPPGHPHYTYRRHLGGEVFYESPFYWASPGSAEAAAQRSWDDDEE